MKVQPVMKLDFAISSVLAPMAEITDAPFRATVRKFSRSLMISEMISAAGVWQKNHKTLRMLKLEPLEQPIGIQIFGHSPEIMGEAAKKAEQEGAVLIDINMGCPVRKIVNDGNGAALMQNEKLAGQIVEAVVAAVKIPVSVKFRAGWNSENINAVSFAKVMEAAGASLLTIHGRTRAQFYSGLADWQLIRQVREAVSIPLIGNGDIRTPEEALKKQHESGVAGVMIGRAVLGRPWLMGQIEAACVGNQVPENPSLPEQKQFLLEHLGLMLDYYTAPRGIYLFRKHICWYVSGMRGAAKFRQDINTIEDIHALTSTISDFYDKAGEDEGL